MNKDQKRLDNLYKKIIKIMTKEQQNIVHEIVELEYNLEKKCNI